MFEPQPRKVLNVTLKDVIQRLEALREIEHTAFKDAVIEAFDEYDYEGEEEVTGFENWPDISAQGQHELHVKIDHEDAYEFSIHITGKDGLISVTEVL